MLLSTWFYCFLSSLLFSILSLTSVKWRWALGATWPWLAQLPNSDFHSCWLTKGWSWYAVIQTLPSKTKGAQMSNNFLLDLCGPVGVTPVFLGWGLNGALRVNINKQVKCLLKVTTLKQLFRLIHCILAISICCTLQILKSVEQSVGG